MHQNKKKHFRSGKHRMLATLLSPGAEKWEADGTDGGQPSGWLLGGLLRQYNTRQTSLLSPGKHLHTVLTQIFCWWSWKQSSLPVKASKPRTLSFPAESYITISTTLLFLPGKNHVQIILKSFPYWPVVYELSCSIESYMLTEQTAD